MNDIKVPPNDLSELASAGTLSYPPARFFRGDAI